MGGAHDLVVLPALAVAVLPAAVLIGGNAVAIRECFAGAVEERQAIEKVTHGATSYAVFGIADPPAFDLAPRSRYQKYTETPIAITASTT